MITIWKLENESWTFVEELGAGVDLLLRLTELREDGNEYRAEIRIESTSQILGV